jgi:regulator of sigma E protease
MYLILIIAFLSLVALIIVHELGHFLIAKKLGVKVEEFGLGFPPRIWGKKIGETLYSINWIPFGGFVKIYGHEEPVKGDPRSFSERPFWQKSLIILGGVLVFWVVAVIILSIVMAIGAPTAIDDSVTTGLINPKVQIMAVQKGSPAEAAGLKIGDIITGFDKVSEVQNFTEANKGKNVVLSIKRGAEIFNVNIILRQNIGENEGAMGVALVRTDLKKYPWYIVPIKGIEATFDLTYSIIASWIMLLGNIFSGQGVPPGVQVTGIVGIFQLFTEVGSLGVSYFLQFVAIIAIHLAIINSLPIPALDGGWFFFMLIEKIKGKPLNQILVQRTSAVFFFLLVGLMIWITIRDVIRIF